VKKDSPEGDPYILLPKSGLDKACKDTKHKSFDENFAVQLELAETAMSGVVKDSELAGEPVRI